MFDRAVAAFGVENPSHKCSALLCGVLYVIGGVGVFVDVIIKQHAAYSQADAARHAADQE